MSLKMHKYLYSCIKPLTSLNKMNSAQFQSLPPTNTSFVNRYKTAEGSTNDVTPVIMTGVIRVYNYQPLLGFVVKSPDIRLRPTGALVWFDDLIGYEILGVCLFSPVYHIFGEVQAPC